MSVIVNRRDLDFLLYELEDIESLFQTARFAHMDRTQLEIMLDTAQSLAEEHYLPAAAGLDAEEPSFVDGTARVPRLTQHQLW